MSGASDAAGAGGHEELLEDLLAGEHRALARVISKIEDRAPGYRDLVSDLYAHTGGADVIGITGSPGAGKSTLVDKLAETYRDRGETVGIIAIDPLHRLLAVRCSATGFEWPRLWAIWTSSCGR